MDNLSLEDIKKTDIFEKSVPKDVIFAFVAKLTVEYPELTDSLTCVSSKKFDEKGMEKAQKLLLEDRIPELKDLRGFLPEDKREKANCEKRGNSFSELYKSFKDADSKRQVWVMWNELVKIVRLVDKLMQPGILKE